MVALDLTHLPMAAKICCARSFVLLSSFLIFQGIVEWPTLAAVPSAVVLTDLACFGELVSSSFEPVPVPREQGLGGRGKNGLFFAEPWDGTFS